MAAKVIKKKREKGKEKRDIEQTHQNLK